jgi:hypothetical protein
MDLVTNLEAGIAATNAGKKAQGRLYFDRVLAEDPANETAWLWLSKAMPTLDQALQCLNHLLTLNPHHMIARQARDVLHVHLMVEESGVLPEVIPPPSTAERRYCLGEALVEAGVITQLQLEVALREQVQLELLRQPVRLGEILLRRRLVRPEQLEGALAAQIESLPVFREEKTAHQLGDHLIGIGLVTRAQLHQGLAEQALQRRLGQNVLIGEVLVRQGYLRRDQLNRALLEWRYPYKQYFWSEEGDDSGLPMQAAA